jgi:hypothetical protein
MRAQACARQEAYRPGLKVMCYRLEGEGYGGSPFPGTYVCVSTGVICCTHKAIRNPTWPSPFLGTQTYGDMRQAPGYPLSGTQTLPYLLTGPRPGYYRAMKSADSLARQYTERAIETLAEVLTDPFAENKDRIKAADSILDRGHGKPLAATIQLPMNRQQAARLAGMSDEELLQIIQGSPLPRLAAPEATPIDAEFTSVSDPLLA